MLSANEIARILKFIPPDDTITIQKRPIARGLKINLDDKAFYFTWKMKDGTELKDLEVLRRLFN